MENEEKKIHSDDVKKAEQTEKNSRPLSCALDPQWLRTVIERCNELCGERLMN